jgi:hypothetical protein
MSLKTCHVSILWYSLLRFPLRRRQRPSIYLEWNCRIVRIRLFGIRGSSTQDMMCLILKQHSYSPLRLYHQATHFIVRLYLFSNLFTFQLTSLFPFAFLNWGIASVKCSPHVNHKDDWKKWSKLSNADHRFTRGWNLFVVSTYATLFSWVQWID